MNKRKQQRLRAAKGRARDREKHKRDGDGRQRERETGTRSHRRTLTWQKPQRGRDSAGAEEEVLGGILAVREAQEGE